MGPALKPTPLAYFFGFILQNTTFIKITIITTTAMDTQNPIFNPSHSHVPKRGIQILFQFILHLLTEALNSDEHKLFSSLFPACNE